MADTSNSARDARGEWRPGEPIQSPPISTWRLKLAAVVRWMVAWPGYLWPFNAFWLMVATATWFFLTPELSAMQTLEWDWVGLIVARDFAFAVLLYGDLQQLQKGLLRVELCVYAPRNSFALSGNL